MNSDLLRKCRARAGYTQEDMAHLLGYKDKSGYCLLENGITKMALEQAVTIKRVLKLTMDDFSKIFL